MRLLAIEKPLLDDLVIRIPLMTGLSPRELADLTLDDIYYEYNLLFVWRSKTSRDHPAVVDSDTIWRIHRYVDKRKRGLLLDLKGTPRLKVQHMRRIVKKWAARVELVRWHRVTPYTLRHTFCIKWIMAHGDLESLRRQLGLKSLEKLRHYLDFDYSHVQEEYRRIYGGTQPFRPVTPPEPMKIPYAA